jgi:hypothetical protein
MAVFVLDAIAPNEHPVRQPFTENNEIAEETCVDLESSLLAFF